LMKSEPKIFLERFHGFPCLLVVPFLRENINENQFYTTTYLLNTFIFLLITKKDY
jgi:hypothetical protein